MFSKFDGTESEKKGECNREYIVRTKKITIFHFKPNIFFKSYANYTPVAMI